MTKIRAEHLARKACVYVRQSTFDQVQNNRESRLRQYGLADRARNLGWPDVSVIDDDLGRSGSGVHRPGFERLLAALCSGEVPHGFLRQHEAMAFTQLLARQRRSEIQVAVANKGQRT
ncbi:recombinase family protein [Caballeronia sp. S22]|uniref:recombinase family protein n=1 Tax=Caballeronia sp. S22 TaxID=3137182 RepID=UPI003530D0E0